jgi:hypothetical protein
MTLTTTVPPMGAFSLTVSITGIVALTTSGTTATGTMIPIVVTDTRNTYPGWSVSGGYPRLAADWHASSGALVLLAARDELELSRLRVDVAAAGLRAVPFHEPDLGGALTAIAVEPAGRRFLARLPLVHTDGAFSCGEEVTR